MSLVHNPEETRQSISIIGQVVAGPPGSEDRTPLANAVVEISTGPAEFESRRALRKSFALDWDHQLSRFDRKRTAQDGSFFFMDLPPGAYSLKVSTPGFETRFKAPEVPVVVTVQRVPDDPNKGVNVESRVFDLSATTLLGRVVNKDNDRPVVDAKMMLIQGDDRRVAMTNEKGEFRFVGVSTDGFRLSAGAPKYESVTKTDQDLAAQLIEQGKNNPLDFELPPNSERGGLLSRLRP